MLFLEKMSKKSVEPRGDTDVQIVRCIPLGIYVGYCVHTPSFRTDAPSLLFNS